jgi:tRNA threonylcarbamoyl adenosine modification protein YjeE
MSPSPARFLGHDYMRMESVVCPSELATLEFGQRLARHFAPGDLIALTGDLGAGKTTWVRGLARSMGLHEDVHSPTYALIHSYGNPPKLHHLDLYRLAAGTDWNELGLSDLFDSDAMLCIEWPERMPEGTRFHHWIDIQFSASLPNAIQPRSENPESGPGAETRVIQWFRSQPAT